MPSLIEKAQLFLSLAIGRSTRQSYSSGVKSYIKFVDEMKLTPAFPASTETICLWVTSLASAPHYLKVGTIKVYLSGVIHHHKERGFHNPLENAPPMLDMIFTGIKRWAAHSQQNNDKKPKLPITTDMLRVMSPLLNQQRRTDALVLAMAWVALVAMLRISEFTIDSKNQDRTLTMEQLNFTTGDGKTIDSRRISNKMIIKHATLRLAQSKTDPFRMGTDIIISSAEAIQILINYLQLTSHEEISLQSPLFRYRTGEAVNRQWFMREISTLIAASGFNTSNYSSHSFRKGGAVSLQQRGVADSIIKKMGRWRSDAYHLYLRQPAIDTIINAGSTL